MKALPIVQLAWLVLSALAAAAALTKALCLFSPQERNIYLVIVIVTITLVFIARLFVSRHQK